MATSGKRRILDFLRRMISAGPMEPLVARLTRGHLYGSPLTKIVPNHYQYPTGSTRDVERDGIRYRLDISDIVDWFIYFGFRETSRIKLYNLIGQGRVFIDVGANIGDVSMHAAQILKGKGKVIALEPDPDNYKRLMANLAVNSFENIQPFNLGAGRSSGNYTIHSVSPGNAGMNRILPEGDRRPDGRQITLTTLDQLITELALSEIDLIKIDTEGFEMNVLAGAVRSIERFLPALFIEIDDNNLRQQGSNPREVVDFLQGFGYACLNSENGKTVCLDDDFTRCHFDLIAKHDKKRCNDVQAGTEITSFDPA